MQVVAFPYFRSCGLADVANENGSGVHSTTPVRLAAQWAPRGVGLLSEAGGVPISVLSPRILKLSLRLAVLTPNADCRLCVPVNILNNLECLETFR